MSAPPREGIFSGASASGSMVPGELRCDVCGVPLHGRQGVGFSDPDVSGQLVEWCRICAPCARFVIVRFASSRAVPIQGRA